MTVPSNSTYANGTGVLSGDQLNTFVQSCTTAAVLRTFVGLTGMTVYLQGTASVADGTAGAFYWNASSVGPDDGVNTIVPNGVTAGAWVRLTVSGSLTGATISGTPSQLHTPIGQTSSAYAIELVTGTTSRSTTSEFGTSINLTSSTGKGASIATSGNKVGLYVATNATANSGNVWAFNPLLLLSTGANALGGAQIAEFDLANNSGTNFGDAADSNAFAQPAVFGVQITGISTNRSTAAVAVLGNIGGSNPMWNNGIVAANTSIRQRFLWDLTNSGTSFDITGAHTYGIDFRGTAAGGGQSSYSGAAIRFGTQNAVAWRNQADSADLTMLQADSTNNLLVGNAAGGVKFVGASVGFYSVAPVAQQTVTGAKGGNAALTSLMSALAALGLVVDGTT